MVDLLTETNKPLLQEREDRFAAEYEISRTRFFHTSAMTGEGVNELFQAVAEYCAANVQDLKLYNGEETKEEVKQSNDKKCCVIQ